MKILVQKVSRAHVCVDCEIIGEIQLGLVLFVGFTSTDTPEDLEYLAKKVAMLRIFPDESGKMNRNILDMNGEILSISQFTLYGNTDEGNRPSFTQAAPGEIANGLFDDFNQILRKKTQLSVKTGKFGAHMEVHLVNDGPVTLLLESKKKKGF